MILQYKGYNNNWCYEEAERISWANVWVGKETRDYREGGKRYELYQEELKKNIGFDKGKVDLDYVHEMHNAVDKLIAHETHFDGEIVYIIGDMRFDMMENVCVAMLEGKNVRRAYVFTNSVYILNNNGGTVQKIA